MDFTHFTAGSDDAGRRLDRVLRTFLADEQLSSIYKALRKGLVKVDGKKCAGNFRVSEGSDIEIADILLKNSERKLVSRNSSDFSVSLKKITVFKNDAILILNKPYDISVQPSSAAKEMSLSSLVQADYEETHEKSSLSFKTGPLHRLDRKTTGLIAFSQNLEGAKWFSEAIRNHAIQKIYLAILEGNLTEAQIWEDKILKTENGKMKNESEVKNKIGEVKNFNFHTVTLDSENGKIAHTEVTPLSHGIFAHKGQKIPLTLAQILIKTGRTHQIRAQASRHGFPLLGDTAYNGTKIDSHRFGEDFFLHAKELLIPTENPLALPQKITAPLPESFTKFLENSHFPPYNQ